MSYCPGTEKGNRRCERLFHFTEYEEWMMRRAMKQAAIFMRDYGKGREPYMINLKNYIQGCKPTDQD